MDDRPEDGRALLIREGTPADAPFIVGLGEEAFARFGDYRPVLEEFLARPEVCAWIAVEAGEPAGFALVERPPAANLADLVAIAVDAGRRRAGIGRALLERVVEDVAAQSAPALLVLTVAEDNPGAIALFREFGFRFVPGPFGRYAGGQNSRRMVRVVGPRSH